MCDSTMPDHAILDVWRDQGAARVDPFAFHYMLALRRRAPDANDGVRCALEARLSGLIAAYAGKLDRTDTATKPQASTSARTPLGELTEQLANRPALRAHGEAAVDAAARPNLPELELLDDVRTLWAQVRSDSQLRRSLQPASEDTGPLNSSSLVHRSLSLMRELSPGYLQQFLSYLDALSWLEQLQDSGVLAGKDAPTREIGKPRARAKPRKRRE